MAKRSKVIKDNALFRTIYERDCAKLVELAAQNKSKKSTVLFKDMLAELSDITHENKRKKIELNKSFEKDECVDSMWRILSELVIEKTDGIFLSKNTSSRKSKENADKKLHAEVSQLIQAAVDLVFVIFEEGMEVTKGLLHLVVFLNRVLFEIPNTMENVKNNIALMCEKMYHLKYVSDESEHIIFNTLIYLIRRSLARKATKKDVKRVYALREIVTKVLNMKEVDTKSFIGLLKQCVSSPIYLSLPEGQKMLSFILTIDVDYVAEFHSAIKKRLPSCSLVQGMGYGKVYYEAWYSAVRKDSETLRNELEMMCIQDILVTAVKSRQKSVVLILRKVLSQFHCQKKEVFVAKMLYYLYRPIIWRYLKNPDGLVRSNTAQIFLDVFPLEDPDVKLVATDMELNEQLLLIKDLLLDDFPIVRSASVIGLCIAMSVNWELFPEDMLRTYFKIIVNDLSCDSSCSEVRCAVAKGFKVLLENPLTIPTLQSILPNIRCMFNDHSENVRIAFCQLLLRVKRICGIKYYEIVDIPNLLGRLEEDRVVAKLLVNLLHNSYFPKAETPFGWLNRIMELLRTGREASKVFFQFVPCYIGLEATAQFMIQAVKTIHTHVKSLVIKKREKSGNVTFESSHSNKENQQDIPGLQEREKTAMGLQNPDIVSALLDGVAIMWVASLHELEKPENKNILKMIVAKLAKCLGDLSIYYKETSVWQSVYFLSSFMPSTAIPSLASLCFYRLKNLHPDVAQDRQNVILLECVCNHNQATSALDLFKEWILEGLKEANTPPIKKRKSKSKSRELLQPIMGAQMLNTMLDHRTCQKVLVSKHTDDLKDILLLCDRVMNKVEQVVERMVTEEEGQFLPPLIYALSKIVVLLHSEDLYDSVPFMENMVVWVQEKLMKDVVLDTSLTLNSTQSNKRISQTNKVSSSIETLTTAICKDLIVVLADMTLIGFFNAKSLKFIKFAFKLLTSGSGEQFLVYVSRLLSNHIAHGILLLMKKEMDILPFVYEGYSKIIQCLNDEDFLEHIPATDVKEIQSNLAGGIFHFNLYVKLRDIASNIISLFTKSIRNSVLKDTESWEVVQKECTMFDKIPMSKSGAFLLNIICLKPKLVVYFLQQIHKNLCKSENLQSWVTCYVVIIKVWDLKSMSKNVNKEIRLLMNTLENILSKHCVYKGIEPKVSEDGQEAPVPDKKESEEMEVDKPEELSFEEHCQQEFDKLKELLERKMNST